MPALGLSLEVPEEDVVHATRSAKSARLRAGAPVAWVYRTATGPLDCANTTFLQDHVGMEIKQCFVATPTTTDEGAGLATASYYTGALCVETRNTVTSFNNLLEDASAVL